MCIRDSPNQVIQNENLYFSSTSYQEKESTRENPLAPSRITGTAYADKPFTFKGSPQNASTLNFVTATSSRPTTIPKMEMTALTIEGSIEESLIQRVIRRNASQIRYCYQRVLNRNPGLRGQTHINVVIGQKGRVSDATATSSQTDFSDVSRCIAGRFRRFRFPSHTDQKPVRFKISYRFAP